ncbi:MAG: hypothetical protein ACK4OP_01560 [Gemmobacter sp.]
MTHPTIARPLRPEDLAHEDLFWVWAAPAAQTTGGVEHLPLDWWLCLVDETDEACHLRLLEIRGAIVPADRMRGLPHLPVPVPEGHPNGLPGLRIAVTDGACTATHDFAPRPRAELDRIAQAAHAAIHAAAQGGTVAGIAREPGGTWLATADGLHGAGLTRAGALLHLADALAAADRAGDGHG